ncbi:hypothetical protein [Streptomyces antimycoticus]|uniref:hypothetical protein n=1 Tax=Streptomyces antimycoticus TaxID=68175 RepID=UPI0036CC9CE9
MYFDEAPNGIDTQPLVNRLISVEAVLTAREAIRALSEAQQAARWVEVLAEHEPRQAADFAARAAESAEGALALVAALRADCTAAASDSDEGTA